MAMIDLRGILAHQLQELESHESKRSLPACHSRNLENYSLAPLAFAGKPRIIG